MGIKRESIANAYSFSLLISYNAQLEPGEALETKRKIQAIE